MLQILDTNDIHLWKANLDRDDFLTQTPLKLLSEDERIRAEKFFHRIDHKRFIVSRGLLRTILSRYLDQGPHQILFSYSKYEKPSLGLSQGEEILNFNMSHSAGMAIYAVTRNRKIGIDIEQLVEDFPCEEIAERFFSPKENNELLKIEAGIPRKRAFFTCWTRKEAYIKARGEGLSIPLDEFDVSVSPHEPAKLIANRRDPKEVTRWTLMNIDSSPGYVSALAAEGSDLPFSYFEL